MLYASAQQNRSVFAIFVGDYFWLDSTEIELSSDFFLCIGKTKTACKTAAILPWLGWFSLFLLLSLSLFSFSPYCFQEVTPDRCILHDFGNIDSRYFYSANGYRIIPRARVTWKLNHPCKFDLAYNFRAVLKLNSTSARQGLTGGSHGVGSES